MAISSQYKVSFLKYNDIVYTAAAPAQGQAALEAENNGKPFFTTMTTTPNNADTPSGAYCLGMIHEACRFDESMYDMTREQLVAVLDRNSSNDFLYIEFTYKELGRSEKWFRKQCRALNNDQLKIKREILLEWTKASDVSPFTEEQLDAIDVHVKEEIGGLTLREYYRLELLSLIKRNKVYLVSCDVAGGLDQDSSSITITDPDTCLPVGWFANNKIDTDEFFEMICELIEEHLPRACLIIERNSYGLAIIQRLMKTKYEKNLFFHFKKTKAEKKVGQKSTPTRTKVYGVDTSTQSRELMIDILKKEVISNPEYFLFKRIFDEIRGLERKKTGKIEHGETSHDDVLMSYLIARYVMWYHMDVLNQYFLKMDLDKRNEKFRQISASNEAGQTVSSAMIEANISMSQPSEHLEDLHRAAMIRQNLANPEAKAGGFRLEKKKSSLLNIINLNNEGGR